MNYRFSALAKTLIVLVLLATACRLDVTERPTGGADVLAAIDKPTPGTAALRDTRWVLRELAGRPAAPTQEERFLFLSRHEGRAEGRGGCNRFSGPFSVAAVGELRLGPLTTTRAACPDLTAESEFLQALNQTERYRIKGDTLELFALNDSLLTQAIARFQAGGTGRKSKNRK
jgi:heat shock protein HslJ